MKATELMIGDWVRYKGQTAKVTILSDKVSKIEGTKENDIEVHDGGEIEPLPIRGAILKRNGFHFDELDEQYSWEKGDNMKGISEEITLMQDSDCWICTIYGSNCEMEIEGFTLHSVHELQHLMRCVGITKEIKL